MTRKSAFRLATGIVWIGTTVLTSGCHKYSLVVQPTVPSILEKNRYSKSDYDADVAAYKSEIAGENNPETVKDLRNKIAYGVMEQIDDAYGQYKRRLFSGKADAGVAGDTLVLGLTAASTIATHTPTKTILSALGTAITGVNLSIDKNFFAQQTYQTIALAMETRRDKARDQIQQNLFDNDAEDYPLEAVMRDLVAYFYAGTLPGGLQELQQQAGNAAHEQSQTPQPAKQ